MESDAANDGSDRAGMQRVDRLSTLGTNSSSGNSASALHESPFGSDGFILNAAERAMVRRRAGKCALCGIVQTHERPKKGVLMRLKLRPITALNPNGTLGRSEVYRGLHLSCHGGIVGVKEKLGEKVTREDVDYDRRRDQRRMADIRWHLAHPDDNSSRRREEEERVEEIGRLQIGMAQGCTTPWQQ